MPRGIGFQVNKMPTVGRPMPSAGVLLVKVKVWADSGGGGYSVGTAHPGSAGGILAFDIVLTVGCMLDLFIGSGGAAGAAPAVPGVGGTNGGLSTGGNGGYATSDLNQGAGGGGAGTVVRARNPGGSPVTIGIAGAGAGGNTSGGMATSTAGAARSSGGSLALADTGGNTGSANGANGASAGNRAAGGGGGGLEGGTGGTAADAAAAPRGGEGVFVGVIAEFLAVRDTTSESGMTPKAGGAAGSGSAAVAGAAGRVEITDGAGTAVYSAPGAHTHIVS